MQAIARWGSFFNDGSPTNLPWRIAIQSQYRTQGYECPPRDDPLATLVRSPAFMDAARALR